MIDLSQIIGTANTFIQTYGYTDVNGTYVTTGAAVQYDIEYITRAVVLIISLMFFYEIFKMVIRLIGGRRNAN
jgi:hypothetical protein